MEKINEAIKDAASKLPNEEKSKIVNLFEDMNPHEHNEKSYEKAIEQLKSQTK